MKRSPSRFFRTPPSPRTPSVTSRPRADGGQIIPVGWNWMHSMSIRSAPAHSASAWPSPVDSQEFEVNFHILPTPPDARTTDFGAEDDELAASPARPRPPRSRRRRRPCSSRMILHSMKTSMPRATARCCTRADQLEAGAVADVGEAGVAVATEVALQDPAVGGAVEERPPLLELEDAVGRLQGVQLRPCASCSASCRRASCRGSAPASCPRARRCRARRRRRLRPSRCGPCRGATCRRPRCGRRARAPRSRHEARRRRRR